MIIIYCVRLFCCTSHFLCVVSLSPDYIYNYNINDKKEITWREDCMATDLYLRRVGKEVSVF